jgi:hypothetical protein
MEAALHTAIGAALKIETVATQILCANIRFRDKVHILSTLIDVAPYIAQGDKEQWRKDMRQLADYSGFRNMMAHDHFRPDDSGKGVEFLIVKAKGEFDLPTTIWSPEKFQSGRAFLDKYWVFFDELARTFEAHPSPPNYARIFRRFLDEPIQGYYGPAMQRTMSPVLQDYLSRQAQASPDSTPDPSSGGTSAQTHPKLPD